MRGRSSSAKSRLRSAGYKCNLCGRRLIDAATLERHKKTIHNVTLRDNKVSFKAKPPVQRNKLSNKDKEKVFDALVREEILAERKPKSKNNENIRDTVVDLAVGGKIISNKESELIKNGESLLVEKDNKSKKKELKDVARRVEFECPMCTKTFNVYFTAHKHIQKVHSVNSEGIKVAPNSLDLIQPIRVEQCYRCDSKMRSNEQHICPNITEEVNVASEFVCSGCNQIFVSLKTFDMHVASLHSDAVDSMFFPTKIEFMNWRLEMERQTNGKYSLYGEYESKKVYRCNYARKDDTMDKYTAYFCPSSMVVQDFSKGIQVHFYNKHYDHPAISYTLSSKYKKYSITSFLKNPNEDSSVTSSAYSAKLDDKDLYSQFKKLMDGIVLNAADVDVDMLKTLVEKALEMSTVLTDAVLSETMPTLKPAKSISDQEITEALEVKTVLHKRRRSVDSFDTPPKPAKRTRNKSLFNQNEIKMSPKILNTFSLASNSNSDEFKSDHGDDFNSECIINVTNEKNIVHNKNTTESDTKSSKSSKINTRLTSFNESLSFNDSYKDFIDKNFIGKAEKAKETKSSKHTVKTKLGVFKQTSPRKVENKEDISHSIIVNNKNIGGIKATTSINIKVEDTPTPKVNKLSMETTKVNILSVENPNVTTAKVGTGRMDTSKMTNSQMNFPKVDTPKVNSRGVFPHEVDPLQVNIKKVNRFDSSPQVEPFRGNVSKVNTRNVTSPLVDPLELDIPKVRNRNISSPLVETVQKNTSKVNTRSISSPLVDPLKVITTKGNISKTAPKLNTSKIETPKMNTLNVYPPKLNTAKPNTPKVYTGPGTPKASSPVVTKITPKVAPKVSFEDKATTTHSIAQTSIPRKKIRELKYEVREQENDCNILILKL